MTYDMSIVLPEAFTEGTCHCSILIRYNTQPEDATLHMELNTRLTVLFFFNHSQ